MKSRIPTVFVFQLLLLCCTFVNAQQKKPCLFVTLKGDTVKGLVYDWNHRVNPDSLVFIREKNKKVEWLAPIRTSAVIIDSSVYFVSARVKVDMFYSTRRKPLETYVRADKAVVKNLYLRVLLLGKLSLYVYADENRKEHFYTKTGNEDFRELIYKKVPVKAGAEQMIFEDNRYKEQLKSLMADCKGLEKKIDFLKYTEKDLKKLFTTYNNCVFSEPAYVSKPDRNKISLHILAGVDVTEFSFTGRDYFSHLENSSFKPSVTLLGGLRFIIPLQKKQKKFSLVTDLANRNISLSSYYTHSSTTYDVHMYMDYVKLNIGFRFKLRTPSVEPYIIGGAALNYLVDFTSRKVETDTSTYITTYNVAMQEPQPFDIGFFAGLGVHYNRINIETRYEQSTGFSPLYDLDSHIATVNVILSFRISKNE